MRNGSGANALTLSESAEPVLGSPWNASLDCSGHASGMALLFGFARPTSGLFLPNGSEILVDLTSPAAFLLALPHTGGPVNFSALVPNNVSLIGRLIYTQGSCGGAPGLALSNALDLQVGG